MRLFLLFFLFFNINNVSKASEASNFTSGPNEMFVGGPGCGVKTEIKRIQM